MKLRDARLRAAVVAGGRGQEADCGDATLRFKLFASGTPGAEDSGGIRGTLSIRWIGVEKSRWNFRVRSANIGRSPLKRGPDVIGLHCLLPGQ